MQCTHARLKRGLSSWQALYDRCASSAVGFDRLTPCDCHIQDVHVHCISCIATAAAAQMEALCLGTSNWSAKSCVQNHHFCIAHAPTIKVYDKLVNVISKVVFMSDIHCLKASHGTFQGAGCYMAGQELQLAAAWCKCCSDDLRLNLA